MVYGRVQCWNLPQTELLGGSGDFVEPLRGSIRVTGSMRVPLEGSIRVLLMDEILHDPGIV